MTFTVPKTYDPGDMISLRVLFYNEAGGLADPTSVVLKVRNPLGIQFTFVPIHNSIGNFSYNYMTTLGDPEGRYEYRFEGTGAVISAEEKAFYLNPSDFS